MLAKLCNHTWVQECGRESCNKELKLFFDACDRYEYNCDHRMNYVKVELSECNTKTTITTSSSISTTTETTTTTTTTTEPTTTTTTPITTTTTPTTTTTTPTTTTTTPTTTTTTPTTTTTTPTTTTTTPTTTTTTPTTTTTTPTTTTTTPTTTTTTPTTTTTTSTTTTTTPTTTTTTTPTITTTAPTTRTTTPTTTTSTTTTTKPSTSQITEHKCNRTGRYKPIPQYTELPTSEREQHAILTADSVSFTTLTPNFEKDKTVMESKNAIPIVSLVATATPEIVIENTSSKNVSVSSHIVTEAQTSENPTFILSDTTLTIKKDTSPLTVVELPTEKNNSGQQAPDVILTAVTKDKENISSFLNVTNNVAKLDLENIITTNSKSTLSQPQTMENNNILTSLSDGVTNITNQQTVVQLLTPTASLDTNISTALIDAVTIKVTSEFTTNNTSENKIQNISSKPITTNAIEEATKMITPKKKLDVNLTSNENLQTTQQSLSDNTESGSIVPVHSTPMNYTSMLTSDITVKSPEKILITNESTSIIMSVSSQQPTTTYVTLDGNINNKSGSTNTAEGSVAEKAHALEILSTTTSLSNNTDQSLFIVNTEALDTEILSTTALTSQGSSTAMKHNSDITDIKPSPSIMQSENNQNISNKYETKETPENVNNSIYSQENTEKFITSTEFVSGQPKTVSASSADDENKFNESNDIEYNSTLINNDLDGFEQPKKLDENVKRPSENVEIIVKDPSVITEEADTLKSTTNTNESKSSDMSTTLEKGPRETLVTSTETTFTIEDSNVIETSTSTENFMTTEASINMIDESINELVPTKTNTEESSESVSQISDDVVLPETSIVFGVTEKYSTSIPNTYVDITNIISSEQEFTVFTETETMTDNMEVFETSTQTNYASEELLEKPNTSVPIKKNTEKSTPTEDFMTTETSIVITDESINELVPTKIKSGVSTEIASQITDDLTLTSFVLYVTETYSTSIPITNIDKISDNMSSEQELSEFTVTESITDNMDAFETSTQANYASKDVAEKPYTSDIISGNSETSTLTDDFMTTEESINVLVSTKINIEDSGKMVSQITDDLVLTESSILLDVTEKYGTSIPDTNVDEMSNSISSGQELSEFTVTETITDNMDAFETSTQANYVSKDVTEKPYTSDIISENSETSTLIDDFMTTEESINELVSTKINIEDSGKMVSQITDDLVLTESSILLDVTEKYGTSIPNTNVDEMGNSISSDQELSEFTVTETITDNMDVFETSTQTNYTLEELSEKPFTSVTIQENSEISTPREEFMTTEMSTRKIDESMSELVPTKTYTVESMKTKSHITKDLILTETSNVPDVTEKYSASIPNTNVDDISNITSSGQELSVFTETETMTDNMDIFETSTQTYYASEELSETPYTSITIEENSETSTLTADFITTETSIDVTNESINEFVPTKINSGESIEMVSHVTDDSVLTESSIISDVTKTYGTSIPNANVNVIGNNISLEVSTSLEQETQVIITENNITETVTTSEQLNVNETTTPENYVSENVSQESQMSTIIIDKYSPVSAETKDYVATESSLKFTKESIQTLYSTEISMQDLSSVTEDTLPTTNKLVPMETSFISDLTEESSLLTPNSNTKIISHTIDSEISTVLDRVTESSLGNLTETATEEINVIETSTQLDFVTETVIKIPHIYDNYETMVSKTTDESMITKTMVDMSKESTSTLIPPKIKTDIYSIESEKASENTDKLTLTKTSIVADLTEAINTLKPIEDKEKINDLVNTIVQENSSGGALSTFHQQSVLDSEKISTIDLTGTEYLTEKSSKILETSNEIPTNVVSDGFHVTTNKENYTIRVHTDESTTIEANTNSSDAKIENILELEPTDNFRTEKSFSLHPITPTTLVSKYASTKVNSEPTIIQTYISDDMISKTSQELSPIGYIDTTVRLETITTDGLESKMKPSVTITDIITDKFNMSASSLLVEYSTVNTKTSISEQESIDSFSNISNASTSITPSEVVEIFTGYTIDKQIESTINEKDDKLITTEIPTSILISSTLKEDINLFTSTENRPLELQENKTLPVYPNETTHIYNKETITLFSTPYDIIPDENQGVSSIITTQEKKENVTEQSNTLFSYDTGLISTAEQSVAVDITTNIFNATLGITTNFLSQGTTYISNSTNESYVLGSSNAPSNNDSYVTGPHSVWSLTSSDTQIETITPSDNNTSDFKLNATDTIVTMVNSQTNITPETFMSLNETFLVTYDGNALNNISQEVITTMSPLTTKNLTDKITTRTPVKGTTKTTAKGKGTTKKPPAKGPPKKGTTKKGVKGTTRKGGKGPTKKGGKGTTKKGKKGPTKKGTTKKGAKGPIKKGTTKKGAKGLAKKGTTKKGAKKPIKKGTIKKGAKGPIKKGTTKKGAKGPIKKGTTKKGAKGPIKKGTTKKGGKGPTKKSTTKKGVKGPTKKGVKGHTQKGTPKKGAKGPTQKSTTKKEGNGTTKKVMMKTTKKNVKATTKTVGKGTTKKPLVPKGPQSTELNLTLPVTSLVLTIPTSNVTEISSNRVQELDLSSPIMFDNMSNGLTTATSPFISKNEINLYEESSRLNNTGTDVVVATTNSPTIYIAPDNNTSTINLVIAKTDLNNNAAMNTILNNYHETSSQNGGSTLTNVTTDESKTTVTLNSLIGTNMDNINEIVPTELSTTTNAVIINALEPDNFLISSSVNYQPTSANSFETTKQFLEATANTANVITNATGGIINSLTLSSATDNTNEIVPSHSIETVKTDPVSDKTSRIDSILSSPAILNTAYALSSINNLETPKQSEQFTTITNKIMTSNYLTPTEAVKITNQVITQIDVTVSTSTLINQINSPEDVKLSTVHELPTMATETLTTLTATKQEPKSFLRSWSGFGSALFNKGLILLEIVKPKSDFV